MEAEHVFPITLHVTRSSHINPQASVSSFLKFVVKLVLLTVLGIILQNKYKCFVTFKCFINVIFMLSNCY